MVLRLGWLTSTDDPRLLDGFGRVLALAADDAVEVVVVVCVPQPGHPPPSELSARATDAGVPVLDIAPAPDRGTRDQAVLEALRPFPVDVVLFAGWAWIAGPVFLDRTRAVNIHPAPPEGPTGTEVAVLEELTRRGATAAGLTAHVVTADVDRGTVLTFARIPIAPMARGWPARVHLRRGFDAALAPTVGPFIAATVELLAAADLTRWPPGPARAGAWPVDLSDALGTVLGAP